MTRQQRLMSRHRPRVGLWTKSIGLLGLSVSALYLVITGALASVTSSQLLPVAASAPDGMSELSSTELSAPVADLPPGDAKLFGVLAHLLWSGPERAVTDLDRVRAGGLTVVRVDVQWDQVEPAAKGAFDLDYVARLDTILDMAAARGVRPVLVVLSTPAWARHRAGPG